MQLHAVIHALVRLDIRAQIVQHVKLIDFNLKQGFSTLIVSRNTLDLKKKSSAETDLKNYIRVSVFLF